MKEVKDLKQTVNTLINNPSDSEINLSESDGETPRDKAADESSKSDTLIKTKTLSKNLLTEVVQELDITEKTGADVDEELVQLMEGLLKDKLQEDKIQVRVDKYPRPGNVEGLRTPRVNPLIWNQIPAQVRTSDSKSQKTQNALVASTVAMMKATNLVIENGDETTRDNDKKVVTILTDAITLATQCFDDINTSRRQAMKKDLHRDYSALCTSTTVPAASEYLFGDLSKLTKDISDANKLAKRVRPPSSRGHGGHRKFQSGGSRMQGYQSSRRFQPYARPRNDFLSKGRNPRSKFKKEGDHK
ncbi:uncharacterized protein LOC114538436 [Dendronephthya gigantea]|uniref:uncharacterized protein LOC114538436 n=1 Tax=Dendronephthya gigantea TaxID=151771 RepID=UPI00106CB13B|nr:uncharacterized protein LOC114538436 [Dendronephthya gigantea]